MDLESHYDNQISFASDDHQFHQQHQQHLFHNTQQLMQNNTSSNQISFGMLHHSSSSAIPENFIFIYFSVTENNSEMRPPTLNIFPSQPMHVEPSSTKGNTGFVSSGSEKSSQPSMELSNPKNDVISTSSGPEPKVAKREWNRKGPNSGSEQNAPKTPDHKTLRRLAQNREAARKSRIRKKAYIQQLESSRIRLAQLEQDLQRARSQVIKFPIPTQASIIKLFS
ncbi:hypothetical protein RND71_004337 [Anisodus tanguticus]|uniref:BZIP domain-containing protein n=1 Tax=Anisodus tanguticus TaxID=243964 RepID=A0AAE1VUU1_9SOLA|nr:hypothetical protein RND71_004337 [Anisodus tanguticus]